ncbi:hypothetical protein ACHHYP_02262 [Achlya hypogyna]|uniref:Ankyrin repeat protein n=1 Tax=Achlya hypogyna TaxID=1202772 RepID=A0A1V9Z7J2_ACHHY|nr:hypothetical protein ACHHYP_02262 [Achlya hypogyna]
MTQFQSGVYLRLLEFQRQIELVELPLKKNQTTRDAIVIHSPSIAAALATLIPSEKALTPDDLCFSRTETKDPHIRQLIPIYIAMALGDTETLLLYRRCRHDLVLPPRALVCAAKYGRNEIVAHLLQHFDVASAVDEAFVKAAAQGHLTIVTLLKTLVTDKARTDAVMQTAAHGHLAVLDYLLQLVDTEAVARSALKAALYERQTDTVYHLIRRFPTAVTNSMVNKAVLSGDVVLLAHLCSTHGVMATPGAWYYAGLRPTLATVRFLHEHDVPGASEATFDRAAALGTPDLLSFLADTYGLEGTVDAMNLAAAAGNLDVVRHLHDHHGVGCTTDAMDQAAGNGHLAIVRFLHEHRSEGCSLFAVDGAVAGGHTEVVRFLCEHRSEGFSDRAIPVARLYGYNDIAEYLESHIALEKEDNRPLGPWVGYSVYGLEL